jgi:hypothetical protein
MYFAVVLLVSDHIGFEIIQSQGPPEGSHGCQQRSLKLDEAWSVHDEEWAPRTIASGACSASDCRYSR